MTKRDKIKFLIFILIIALSLILFFIFGYLQNIIGILILGIIWLLAFGLCLCFCANDRFNIYVDKNPEDIEWV